MNKIQAISKGSQIIDQIFWELFVILSAKGGSASGGKSSNVLTEVSVANFIKRRAKELGGHGMAFPPIVSFGSSSAEIHHKPSKKLIGKNNFLMLDYGVKVNGFCSDFTRTLFLGKPSKYQEKIYNIVLDAQLSAIKKVTIGNYSDEVDHAARHIINRAGFGKNYTHGTGHGVTRKIHDLPNFKPNSGDEIKNNDVVTVEPGIYLPRKFGVRIEDMILVNNKPKIFSRVPKDFRSMIVK